MLNAERKQLIMESIEKLGVIKLQELVEGLATSESTIRRDLTSLEKDKKLKRTHGGVMIEEK
ncbi:DeoR/GlpR transcriptional regulator, partial [Escherichia coli]|nr:DeoR/GlpR transcriptional regulator [Escherichia coli]